MTLERKGGSSKKGKDREKEGENCGIRKARYGGWPKKVKNREKEGRKGGVRKTRREREEGRAA